LNHIEEELEGLGFFCQTDYSTGPQNPPLIEEHASNFSKNKNSEKSWEKSVQSDHSKKTPYY